MTPPPTTNPSTADADRWYFAELQQGKTTPDRNTLDRFLDLDQSDVDWIATSAQFHRLGQTWAGLSRLLAREGHTLVREIGVPAATSWATHLNLTSGTPNRRGEEVGDAPLST